MKIVVNALLGSVSGIMNVGIVIFMIWIMFAILAVSFLKGHMGYCYGPIDYYGINYEYCTERYQLGWVWKNWDWNFDNITNAFITLFVLSSLEGWPQIMATVFDAAADTTGPIYNGNVLFGTIYFISFILVGALFLMNLFVGVIFFQFQAEKEKEEKERFQYLTKNQMKWIFMQDLIIKATPEFELSAPPKNKIRLFVFKIVTGNIFDSVIIICIVLNVAVMGMEYDGMSTNYEAV